MTISADEPLRAGPYYGDGVAVQFDFDFTVFEETELLVLRQNADSTYTVLSLTVDYTVTFNDPEVGGYITLVDPGRLPSGASLTITPNAALEQPYPFRDQGALNLRYFEDALDRLVVVMRGVLATTSSPEVINAIGVLTAAAETFANQAAGSASTATAAATDAVSARNTFPGRNLLVNALGNMNRRGYVSGAAVASANTYAIERWRVVTAGQSLSWVQDNGFKVFTAPAGGVEQPVDGEEISTGTYVLSWDGTATATVDGVPVAKGGTVSLTGGTNAVVRFIGGTFSKPQLEAGTLVTAFDHRPAALELMMCRRFYNVVDIRERFDGNAGGTFTVGRSYSVRPPMRRVPDAVLTASYTSAQLASVNQVSASYVELWWQWVGVGPGTRTITGNIALDAEIY